MATPRAYKAVMFLANRVGTREQPCSHCEGQGVRLSECIYQHSDDPCPFCFGLGVDPETYVKEDHHERL